MRKSTIAATVAVLAAAATIAAASEHGEREHHGERGEGEHHRRGGDRERGRARAVAPAGGPDAALYRKECGACHLAFPPGFLPAESHRRILAGLDRHFGQNAELDDAARDAIERYLVANAAPGAGAALRLTEAPWFERKHRRIGPAVVARPSVRSRANCAACHLGAADWDFDDDRVRIPAS